MEKEVNENSSNLEEDISLLRQLVNSLEESEEKLEEAYKNQDAENFNKAKKFILKIQNKIDEIIK